MQHRDRRFVLVPLGLLLLAAGIGCAFLGPVETSAFALFSRGGRFAYDGFGFGSFMFGNIALQVAAYYMAAAVLIPLGYGHLRLRRWARPLTLALLWAWAVLGLPLLLALFFMTVSVKDLGTPGGMAFIAALAASYLLLPWLGIRWYRGRNIRGTFEAHDRLPVSRRPGALELRPLPILVICLLDLFFLAALHAPLLFRGLFPAFGALLGDMEGAMANGAAILLLALLLWGTWNQHLWAWLGSFVYYGALSATWLVTFALTSYADLLAWLRLPPTEMEFLSGIPLQGFEIGILAGLPMLATAAIVLVSVRQFQRRPDWLAAQHQPQENRS